MPVTIKGYRSAISSVLKAAGNLGADSPFINYMLRNMALTRPAQRVFIPKRDLGIVLTYIATTPFEPLGSATMEQLTLKTVFLLLLASGKRRSEIAALSSNSSHIQFTANYASVRLLFEPGFLAKNQVPLWKPAPLHIPALPQSASVDRTLCPVRALKVYLARTESTSIRKGRTRLFIPFRGDNDSEITSRSISMWTVKLIKEAYAAGSTSRVAHVNTHEIRALASSWAIFNSVPFNEVMISAYWRSDNSFVSHYLRSRAQHADSLYAVGPIVAASAVIPQVE